MADLPTGTVTFLFTDIEGSTKLWEQHPQAMEGALARHDALAAEIIPRRGGVLVKQRGEGDSLFAVFPRAADAVAAAVELQRLLTAEAWPVETPLRVRMALHTGDATLRAADYFGAAVNRCARLRAAAHGGQVLLSAATQEVAQDHLPDRVDLRDLGEHPLRDLARPERIFQLLHPELTADFPPLLSLNIRPNNLPQQVTSFVGREKEIAQVRRRLESTRLLTLTGSGGTGKTRLALQVAADVLHEYPAGVWFVELAALSDPALVPQTVAAVLGIREEPGKPLTETLIHALNSKRPLLLLDNCEHLLTASSHLAEALLRGCAGLRVLATSREGLNIPGETTVRLPSLSAPDPRHLPPTLEGVTEYEAVRLFLDRATAALPAFVLTEQNTAAVAQVCHRLDGIPLAIELAAARVKALPVERINERLDDRFRLLTGGSRTALPRQQTLRALIDWSYELLTGEERVLLHRLSVFAWGWTLEAAETVCADVEGANPFPSTPRSGAQIEAWKVIDVLTALVEKSLVVYEEQQAGVARYRFLETVRQYSRERLIETGEAEAVRSLHSGFFLRLAEEAEPNLVGPDRRTWLTRLDLEHENLLAALAWSMERGDGEAGLRLGVLLSRFWEVRGYLTEGREHLTKLLSLPGSGARTVVRGRALNAAGGLTIRQGDYEAARALFEESLAIGRELGDQHEIGASLNYLGEVVTRQGDYEAARALFEESLAIGRELGDKGSIAWSLHNLGTLARNQGGYEAARALFEEGLALFRELDNKGGIAWSFQTLGTLAMDQGDYEAAWGRYEEGLALFRELGSKGGIALSLNDLGTLAMDQGDYEAAQALYEESLALFRELGDDRGIDASLRGLGHMAREVGDYARCAAHYRENMALRQSCDDRWAIAQALEDFAGLAGRQRQWERAVRLLGAAQDLIQTFGRSLPVAVREEYQRTVEGARAALGEKAFATAWAEGRAMTAKQAVAYALEAPSPGGAE